MADNAVEYIVSAQDNASIVLNHIAGGVNDLSGAMLTLARAQGPFGAIAAGFAGMAVAAGAGAIALSDEVEQLDRLSSISGVSIDNLKVMRQVMSEAGGDADGLQSAFVKLNRAIQDGNPLLDRLGIDSRDTFSAFRQLALIITESTDVKERDKVATELLGKAGADLIPDLEAVIRSFDGVRQAMERNGSLMKGDALDSARQLDSEIGTLSRNWEGAMTRIKSATIPVTTEIVQAFNTMWDAITGAGSNPTLADLDRRIAGAQAHLGRLKAEAERHGDPNWNINTQRGVEGGLARLQNERFQLLRSSLGPGSFDVQNRPQPLLGSGGGTNPFDAFAVANRGWFAGKAGASPNDRMQAEIVASYEMSNQALQSMGETMQQLEAPALRFTEAGLKAAERMLLIEDTINSLSSSVQSDMSAISANVLAGMTNLREGWHQLMRALLSDLTSSAADFGVGLLFDLIPIPGAGTVGSKVDDVFRSTSSRGGDTYNISALSARDVLQELTSPTGSLRGANDYVRTVSRASRR